MMHSNYIVLIFELIMASTDDCSLFSVMCICEEYSAWSPCSTFPFPPFIPFSSSVIIMVPGPKEFQAVQLYGEWKSDSMTLLMVRVERTAPPWDGGLLCSTVYLSISVPFSFSQTFSFHAQTCNKDTKGLTSKPGQPDREEAKAITHSW